MQSAVNNDILLRDYMYISSPLAPFSEHQRTQDTLRTDEPSPSISLFEHWKDSIIREAGYTFTPLLQYPIRKPVLSSTS